MTSLSRQMFVSRFDTNHTTVCLETDQDSTFQPVSARCPGVHQNYRITSTLIALMNQSNGDPAAVCFDQTEHAKYEHT